MPTELQSCPQRNQLVDYLLGKLPSEDSSFCEAHIADCEPCEETIRSLDASDTLSELALNGIRSSEKSSDQESAVINQLVSDIEGWSESSVTGKRGLLATRHDSDLLDRTAEVQHIFDECSDEDSIGIVGKYRIVELLGAGSSGVVYRAIDTQLGRDVAMKFLRPSLGVAARQRFLTEAQAAAVINHPNVVQIYDVGMEDKLAFIAMQCLPGQTLEQLLADRGAVSGDETRRIGKQIAVGLAAAHHRGIVHRDIKPANIWICSETENVTILDFGLARILDEDPQLTCTGLIAGTPCFMSPEQTRGRDIDRRSDFFSLGCLLYQCLTGVLPFKSENVLATLQSVQLLTPTAPADLDPSVDSDLSSLVMTLLEKSPVNRPDQADDIAAAFDLPVSDWNFAPAKNRQSTLPINSDPKTKVASQPAHWWPTIAALVAFGLILAGAYFMPQIIRIATNKGQIVIESNDPDVQIEVLQGGELIEIVDLKTKQKLNIIAGEYQIRPMGSQNEISIDKQKVTISRGSETIVRVTREQDGATAAPADDTNPLQRGELAGTVQVRPFESIGGEVADVAQNKQASDEPTYFKTDNYLLDSGDVLGVFIENVLGDFGSASPVQIPDPGSDLPPAIGFPISVGEGGKISLPLIPKLMVRGKSLEEAEDAIKQAYRGGPKPILLERGRIIVTLLRKRGNLTTFNGKTYAQCYKVVKYERNPELAWPSVRGLIELYDEERKEEAIQTCLEFLRRTEFTYAKNETNFLKRVGTIVDADALAGMLLSEVHSGTHLSQGTMVDLLSSYTPELKRKAIFKDRHEDLAKAIIESANDNKLGAYHAALLLNVIHADTGLELNSFEGFEKTIFTVVSSPDFVNQSSFGMIDFALDTLSNSPEIVAAVYGMALKTGDSTLTKFIFEKLTELSPDQLKILVPMIQENEVYVGFKRELKNTTRSEGLSIRLSPSQRKILNLVAAFGDHAKTKTLISDFEVFETWDFDNEGAYGRARKAVLGK